MFTTLQYNRVDNNIFYIQQEKVVTRSKINAERVGSKSFCGLGV